MHIFTLIIEFAAILLVFSSYSFSLILPKRQASCPKDSKLSRQRRHEALKQEIILRLGYDREPDGPNPNFTSSPESLQEYNAIKKVQELTRESKPCLKQLDFSTKEIFVDRPTNVTPHKPLPRSILTDDCESDPMVEFFNVYKIRFPINLNIKDYSYTITDAQLHLKKYQLSTNSSPKNGADRVEVFHVTKPANYWDQEYPRFITALFLYSDDNLNNDIAVFNVTDAIKQWLTLSEHTNSPIGEIQFEVRIRCSVPLTNGRAFIPNFQFFEKSDHDGTLHITTTKEKITNNQHPRMKRETERRNETNYCKPNQFRCCLKKDWVNFDEAPFNASWILRPKRVAINYCSGECPLYWGLSRTLAHAHFLGRVRERAQNNPAAAPEPCCVPNTYDSAILSVYENGRETRREFGGIIVTSCVCK